MIWVGLPAIPREIEEKKVYVPTITFDDKEIWKLVITEIKKELEYLKN